MRRSLLLALCAALVAGLAIASAGLAGDRPDRSAPAAGADRSAPPQDGPFAHRRARGEGRRHGRRHGHGHGHGAVHRRVVRDLAERLDVTPARLRTALRAVKTRFRANPVDPRTASPAERAALKERLAADLARELGTTPERVVAAVRAEVVDGLRFAVAVGAVTERGRELALGCFDDPAACDLAALRAEVRFRHGRHHRRGR